MRVIIITLFLFTARAVAENADIGKVNSPAEDADTDKAIAETYESSALFKKFVTHCSSHVAETCSESEAVHQEVGEKNGAYGLGLCLLDSMNKCLVDHEASLEEATPTKKQDPSNYPQLAKKPTENGFPFPFFPPVVNKPPIIKVPPKGKPDKPPKDKPNNQVETLKFQAVLRTCSHVSARTCFTHPNVDASLLSACLVPSMNQCVYPKEKLVRMIYLFIFLNSC